MCNELYKHKKDKGTEIYGEKCSITCQKFLTTVHNNLQNPLQLVIQYNRERPISDAHAAVTTFAIIKTVVYNYKVHYTLSYR